MSKQEDWSRTNAEILSLWQSIWRQITGEVYGTGAATPENTWAAFFGASPTNATAQNPYTELWKLFMPLTPVDPSMMFSELMSRWTSFAWPFAARARQEAPIDALSAFFMNPFGAIKNENFVDREWYQQEWLGGSPGEFARLLELPALGITREWQEKIRHLMVAQADYAKASNRLARELATIYLNALKRFSRAINTPDDGAEITSLRALFDYWVEHAEDAYARHIRSDTYARIFARYINTGATYRKTQQALLDDVNELLNVPSRREIDALIHRQHALEKKMRTPSQPAADDRRDARFDLNGIEQRLDALEKASKQATSAPLERAASAPSTKAAPRKKAQRQRKSSKTPARRSDTKKQRKATQSTSSRDEFDIGRFDSM